MEVKDYIMYHYHTIGKFDDAWQVGREIIVDDNSQNKFYKLMSEFNVGVDCSPPGSRISFDRILDYYLDEDKLSKLELSYVRKLLRQSALIIHNTVIYNREVALEKYREQNCPNLPSRFHSIWLADERSLEFWHKQLCENKLVLFKVKVTGNLFKSCDSFIPTNELTISEMNNMAYRYWNPTFQTKEEEEKAEYLFQGKVKVMERLCIPYKNEIYTKQN